MTIFYNTIRDSHLGYAAIFFCIAMGFLFLRKVDKGDIGPGYWAISFFLNSLGFLFWSGVIPLVAWKYYLIGEVFHISGFIFLVCGAYRFAGNKYKAWNLFFITAWLVLWACSIIFWKDNQYVFSLSLKGLRAFLFIITGFILLRKMPDNTHRGRFLAGWSLIAWGLYVIALSFIKIDAMKNLAYGFLVGFQVLSVFGMVAMIVDRIRVRAEEIETQVKRLEGLLPICSYCKKIRDDDNKWHNLESYIKERTTAVFSHGICPDCLHKHYPDFGK